MMNVYSKWGMALALVGATCSMQVSAQAISFDNSDTQDVVFPDMDRAWLKSGAIMDPTHVRSMGLGLTKNQVRSIIQYPHFSEGLFGPKQWDYIFNFKKPDGSYLTCQYQVHFDQDNKTKGTYWNRPECAQFVNPAQKPVIAKMVLAADGMFAFGKGQLSDMDSTGVQALNDVVKKIQAAAGNGGVHQITVEGFTDRFGSNQSNDALSRERALSVKNYLVAKGIDASTIRVIAKGETEPVVYCPGPKTPSVIACLKPNRRIAVTVE